jgi:hypothetical protein
MRRIVTLRVRVRGRNTPSREEMEEITDGEEVGQRSGSRAKKKTKKKGPSKRLGDNKELPPTNEIENEDFVACLEDIMMFHAWYKEGYPKVWKARTSRHRVRISIGMRPHRNTCTSGFVSCWKVFCGCSQEV